MTEDDEKPLLLGEVTPEVKAFLESMGRTILEPEHHATKEVAKARRQSRHVEHHPPAWSPLTTDNWPNVHKAFQEGILRKDELINFELGQRVATAFRFQADMMQYLHTLPAPTPRSDEEDERDREASEEGDVRHWTPNPRRARRSG